MEALFITEGTPFSLYLCCSARSPPRRQFKNRTERVRLHQVATPLPQIINATPSNYQRHTPPISYVTPHQLATS